MKKNIILIGMPSSGKSTIGKQLSCTFCIPFVDTDHLIQNKVGKTPKDIVLTEGLQYFLKVQEEVVLSLEVQDSVIATGGSVIYSDVAMTHLKSNGVVVFLKIPLDEVVQRHVPGRRFAKNEDQDIEDVYRERLPLYEKYADITVDCSKKSEQDILREVLEKLQTAQ